MEIREIEPRELDALLTLYRHLNPDDVPLPSRPEVEATWRAALAQPGCRYFGGYDDGTLITTCTLMIIPNLTRGCRSYGLIENVVTHPDWQNRGHGKQLLAHALSYAWSQGCYKVMLLTGRKEESVFRFYESAGFDCHGKQAFIARAPS